MIHVHVALERNTKSAVANNNKENYFTEIQKENIIKTIMKTR